jgi:acetate---CoA ligase (ADP-forming)
MRTGLDAILKPRSVAIIGASRKPGSIGREIIHNLIDFGFQGPIYPVNPERTHIHSIRAYASVEEIPDPVDLAVVVVPRDHVLAVVEACARKGIPGLVVITAGFREAGKEGAKLEVKVAKAARDGGMRMLGPNCMGVVNSDPEVAMNAAFGATQPLAGHAAFASQSGALGEVVIAAARRVGLGISSFVSVGNKADLEGNDLLEWWETDPNTNVILLYLEDFGDTHRFAALARRITREAGKPILAVKSGRTRQGAAAAASHTGALAGGDTAASSLFSTSGVIRCNTVQELFELGLAFTSQPLPRGRRVAVLTNAGGPGIMATDALVADGFEMADLRPETRAALDVLAPKAAPVHNPVDLIASADPETYRAATELLLADPEVDALLPLFVSPVASDPTAVARGIVAGVAAGLARADAPKPVLSCFMGRDQGGEAAAVLQAARIPVYSFPESAAEALGAMDRFREWRSRPEERIVRFTVDRARAAERISAARAARRAWLTGPEVLDLLAAYGIPTVPSRAVATPEEAIAFADEVGYPLVLKLLAEDVVHKSDVGAVQLDLRSAREVKGAFWEITQAVRRRSLVPEGQALSFLAQKMVSGGREVILGAVEDPVVGHLLMFGLGGVFVELMEDVVFRVLPVTDVDAREMVRGVKGFPLLQGYRGEPAADISALEEVLQRMGQLVGDFPEIAEMDLNPFVVLPAGRGGLAVDARIRLGAKR